MTAAKLRLAMAAMGKPGVQARVPGDIWFVLYGITT
jgi:hypothetical protein